MSSVARNIEGQSPGNPNRLLSDLLTSMFTGEELRKFLRHLDPTLRLEKAIPWSGAHETIADECVHALRRFGYLDSWFFEELQRERPRRSSDIVATIEAFGLPNLTRKPDDRENLSLRRAGDRFLYTHYVAAEYETSPPRPPGDALTAVTRMYEHLRDPAREVRTPGLVIVYGPAGMGKSRTAYEFAVRWQHNYEDIIWLDAGKSGDELTHALGRALAEILPATQETTWQALVARFNDLLRRSNARRLLILDDVSSPDLLRALPSVGNFDVLVTTSDDSTVNAAPGNQRPLLVRPLPMDPATGARLILHEHLANRWSELERKAAALLARRLGGFPLAVALASALTSTTPPSDIVAGLRRGERGIGAMQDGMPDARTSGEVYRRFLDRQNTDGSTAPLSGDPQTAALTDLLRIWRAQQPEPARSAGWIVLRAMAWIAPQQDIAFNLLERLCEALPTDAADPGRVYLETKPSQLRGVLRQLSLAGLIWFGVDLQPAIHPLVQASILELVGNQQALLDERAATLLFAEVATELLDNPDHAVLGKPAALDPEGRTAAISEDTAFWHLEHTARRWLRSLRPAEPAAALADLTIRVVRQLKREGLEARAAELALALLDGRRDLTAFQRARAHLELAQCRAAGGGDDRSPLDELAAADAALDEVPDDDAARWLRMEVRWRQINAGPRLLDEAAAQAAVQRLMAEIQATSTRAEQPESWRTIVRTWCQIGATWQAHARHCDNPAAARSALVAYDRALQLYEARRSPLECRLDPEYWNVRYARMLLLLHADAGATGLEGHVAELESICHHLARLSPPGHPNTLPVVLATAKWLDRAGRWQDAHALANEIIGLEASGHGIKPSTLAEAELRIGQIALRRAIRALPGAPTSAPANPPPSATEEVTRLLDEAISHLSTATRQLDASRPREPHARLQSLIRWDLNLTRAARQGGAGRQAWRALRTDLEQVAVDWGPASDQYRSRVELYEKVGDIYPRQD